MKDLYVVIGSDGISNWLCATSFGEDVFDIESSAIEVAELLSNSNHNYTYKVAKLTFLD